MLQALAGGLNEAPAVDPASRSNAPPPRDERLRRLVDGWSLVPESIKAGIVAMVEAAMVEQRKGADHG
ncbi:MAG: hypothetical protein DHS20C14_18550 [Phycisphaeraceae bacterium]|nr:MAG: hypothetical protein DHS20C14_18550 [Phycisphaeraceae bacterium]